MNSLVKNTAFYAFWAMFGFLLAAMPRRWSVADYAIVLALSLAGLVAAAVLLARAGHARQQHNKFPPNRIFWFVFVRVDGCVPIAARLLKREADRCARTFTVAEAVYERGLFNLPLARRWLFARRLCRRRNRGEQISDLARCRNHAHSRSRASVRAARADQAAEEARLARRAFRQNALERAAVHV